MTAPFDPQHPSVCRLHNVMPFYSKDCMLLLGIAIIWLSSATVNAEDLQFGMRIRPTKGTVQQYILNSGCASCSNRSSDNSNKQQTKIDSALKINKKDSDITHIVKESRAINQNSFTVKPLVKIQQTARPMYSNLPNQNYNRGATFYFTQVEPHRFEYRAMFQHHAKAFHERNDFQPFVHHFEPFSKEFPPLPKFPSFPEFPQVFPDHKNPFANFPEFSFPTLPPSIKRAWQPSTEVQTQRPVVDENFDGPLVKKYDVVLGQTRYPKIFRFNEERINIEDFDREKKLRFYNLAKDGQNELIEPENVKRDHLLILHGGIFTVQEPPLFNKHIKKVRKINGYKAHVS